MLMGTELVALRTSILGHDASGVGETQLQALAAYKDKPFVPNSEGFLPCAYCKRNRPMCEFAAEHLDDAESDRRAAERGRPGESDGTVLVKGGIICRRCLASELRALRKRLQEIHWIELALFMECESKSLVMTTEVELDAVLGALAGRNVMGNPGACGVYAVHFGPKESKCYLGRPGTAHFALLKRHRLFDDFEKAPQDLIMGRFRLYASGEFVVDVCSDLWRGKCGNASPLANLSPEKRSDFEICLLRTFTDTVYLIDMGFSFRAPSINERKLRLLLNSQAEQLRVLRHAAPR